ncbi:MAG: indole-3-glycerol phosphate synthase TrpC [Candidatus Methylopumilus sp.]|nr:indole-3-glycerol phosphate synthase TrpC [Candidatus Methylopumilus sp.]
MVNILDTIIKTKFEEIKEAQKRISLNQLKDEVKSASLPRGFVKAIQNQLSKNKAAVIAEIKKASPSKGVIRENFNPKLIAESYAKSGATCLSVLTDETYFQGHANYLKDARASCTLPVLRKDFMVDPYQIYEARMMGADCILLIVAALSFDLMRSLEAMAHALDMDVLVEVHNQEELDLALQLKTPLLGINNRNLKTFEVSLQTTFDLIKNIGVDKIIVTESGIFTPVDIKIMQDHHVNTFLIGEAFMRESDPGESLKTLFHF